MDKLAETFAAKYQKKLVVFKPDYANYPGNLAPLKRNETIIEHSNFLIAFPSKESRGTYHSINLAKKKGIPVLIIEV